MSGGSPGYQPIWVPVENTTDCSQGFCSRYCPQWCYVTFPPPPPFDVQDSGSTFSPLVIGIIGILASAFIIVSYYTVVAKCCGNRHSTRRRSQATTTDGEDLERNHNAVETWLVPPNSGLDQSTIDSIAVRKYRKGDGLIVSGDCSVCLGEFQEDDRLRLLPKCSHAFHLSCIDRWLQAHSNCPLCRASVLVVSTPTPVSLPQLPSPAPGILIPVTLQSETRAPGQAQEVEEGRHSVVVAEEYGVISSIHGVQEREVIRLVGPNNGGRSQSDLGRKEEAIIEIGDEEIRFLRRSISMDWSSGNSISMAAGMCMNREVAADGLESSSASVCRDQTKNRGEFSRNNKNQNGVRAPPSMLRTSSSERFLLVRGRSAVLLL